MRWLAHKNGLDVNRLQIVAIFRDWKKSEAKRKEDYPQQPIATIDVNVWTLEETEAFIANRIGLHQKSEAGEVVECSDEDRWYSGTTYALMKDGGKRAKKVVPILAELGEIPPGHHVEERPGLNRRCEDYCELAPFCEQFKKLKSESSQEPEDDVDF
jgi:hypothetical protein